MLANALRKQEKYVEAASSCGVEPQDTVEQKLEMLTRKAWLVMNHVKGPMPHVPLNEAAEMSAALETGSKAQAKYTAMIFALQV